MHRSALMPMILLALAIAAPLSAPAAAAAAKPRASTAQRNVQVLAPMTIPGLGRERTIRLYLPPGYASSQQRYAVLYMHDGQNLFDAATSFLGEWQVDEALNRLARQRGLRLIVVGIDNGGEDRLQELAPFDTEHGPAEGDAYLAFIVDVLKPYIDAHYRTLTDRADTAIMGSSLGGLISHYALCRYRDVFGKAALFSPSYWYTPEIYAYSAAHPPRDDARVYFYAGGAEDEHMVGNLERMTRMLQSEGFPHANLRVHVVAAAKHNETAWRAEFPRAIEWLFGAPGR
jgi:predicted alpha/beta superfamily hydrolase